MMSIARLRRFAAEELTGYYRLPPQPVSAPPRLPQLLPLNSPWLELKTLLEAPSGPLGPIRRTTPRSGVLRGHLAASFGLSLVKSIAQKPFTGGWGKPYQAARLSL